MITLRSKKLICLFSMLLSTTLFAQSTASITNPKTVTWNNLPGEKNLEYSVMAGNPLKDSMFIVWLKLPKNYADVVHAHKKIRYDTIISGNYYIGFGDKIDKSQTQRLGVGSFINFPANVNHYGYTHDETIIQISGIGPWEVLKTTGKNR